MYVRIVLLVSIILTLDVVLGGFFYNVPMPTKEQFEERGLKCTPGRTTILIEETKPLKLKGSSEEDTRRTHMNAIASKDETCKVCVCSLEGKDEYCSRRPARNVNECIRLAILKKSIEKNGPFSHDRSLSFRIRRGWWASVGSVQLWLKPFKSYLDFC